ncbi:Mur ligase family protein [Prosthecochloris sp. HL-130-GSB]|uniref:Mur ligase family protein n=1 Tax=Prosthecochloris sp. HL-130-GSB TaxID=1974213 RepID=UPI001E458960|nr:Mur ligase family protein [Prosthecochloris sp. HL-130-GSB]
MEGIRSRGIEVVSEIEVASWFCRATVIAVTGTDGKTTTASLVSAICREYAGEKSFQVFTAGNIGVPFSSVVAQMSSADIAVVEISSYQLETCSTFSPRVSVITNIAPDHLDRYGGSMDAYARAKYRIFASQGEDDVLVVNYDDPCCGRSSVRMPARAPALRYSVPIARVSAILPLRELSSATAGCCCSMQERRKLR